MEKAECKDGGTKKPTSEDWIACAKKIAENRKKYKKSIRIDYKKLNVPLTKKQD